MGAAPKFIVSTYPEERRAFTQRMPTPVSKERGPTPVTARISSTPRICCRCRSCRLG